MLLGLTPPSANSLECSTYETCNSQKYSLKTPRSSENYDIAYARDSKIKFNIDEKDDRPSESNRRGALNFTIITSRTQDRNVIESILCPELFRPSIRGARGERNGEPSISRSEFARRVIMAPRPFLPGENVGMHRRCGRLTTVNILCVTPWPYVSA